MMNNDLGQAEWKPPGQVTPGERRWVWIAAALIMLATTLPYFIGYMMQGEAWRFTGFVFGVEDGNSYIAKMLRGSAGDWLFRSPYAVQEQHGVLMYMIYLWAGKLAAEPGLHEQLVVLYHLLRFVFGMLSIAACYDFLALFLMQVRLRRFGTIIAAVGGGLGWVLVLAGRTEWLGSLPLDFYSPEAFGFLEIFGLPHLALARAGLLWSLVLVCRLAAIAFSGISPSPGIPRWQILKMCGACLLIVFGQPLTIAVLVAVIGVYLLGLGVIHRVWMAGAGQKAWLRLTGWCLAAGALSGFYLLYTFWLTRTDAYIQAWSVQNLIHSPNPNHYLLAYGLVAPLALVGAVRLMRQAPSVGWLALGWVLIFPLLAYAPLDIQRRLTEGVWIAWVALALAAFDSSLLSPEVEKELSLAQAPTLPSRPAAPKLALALPTLTLVSPLILYAGALNAVLHPSPPLFRPIEEVRVFEYLQSSVVPGDVVLASYDTSNPLPAWAPVQVLVGHGPESASLAQMLPQVQAFFTESTPIEERMEIMRLYRVRYIVWGPNECALGDYDLHFLSYRKILLETNNYTLFEIVAMP